MTANPYHSTHISFPSIPSFPSPIACYFRRHTTTTATSLLISSKAQQVLNGKRSKEKIGSKVVINKK